MKKIFFSLFLFAQCFLPSLLALEEQKIVVVIPSYNNKEWAERNIVSCLSQKYDNYTVLYYVDCSDDGSYECIQELLALYDTDHRVTLIHNDIRKGALANHWDAVHRCDDTTIIVHCDGDDWLAHNEVLQRVNEVYADPEVWVTYGQYREYPANTLGHCRSLPSRVIEQNIWRYLSLPLPTTHLRTFRACLFKQILLQDLIHNGTFLPTAGDIAFFWPILEMAGKHVRFIHEVLYAYNIDTDINDFKVRLEQQLFYFNFLRKKKCYEPLAELPLTKSTQKNAQADIVIFSYNRPLQLYAFLESLFYYVKNIGTVTILCRADNQQYSDAYTEVSKNFPSVTFVMQPAQFPQRDFKKNLMDIIENSPNEYILFSVDDIIVKDVCDLQECIDALQKTHAYGFYLRLGKNITQCYMLRRSHVLPLLMPISQNIFAWQFKDGSYDWRYPNTVDMTVYKKETIIDALRKLDYTNPSNLEGNWFIPEYVDYEKVGLCYETSKIVNVPLNVVQKERANAHMNITTEYLLQLFNEGLKIDITPLHTFANQSPHAEYNFSLIAR